MNKLFSFLIIMPFYSSMTVSQVSVSSDGSQPDPSAMLDVKSNTLGFLPPRIALTSINSASPVGSPTAGLLIYNIATNGAPPNDVIPGYYFWNGEKWIAVASPQGASTGDMLYWNGNQWVRLGAGLDGQVLINNNGIPSWGVVGLPVVTTAEITNITANSAISGGDIIFTMGSIVTAKGVCWSTSVDPTIADNYTIDLAP